jgi:hypothetical protein
VPRRRKRAGTRLENAFRRLCVKQGSSKGD